jgi:riboflavin transporter FmnP
MTVRRAGISKTTSLTGAAVFGALAAVIASVSQLPYPDPSFGFLRIDLAEIVDVLAFLIFGPVVGLLTALIHYLFLNFAPSLPIYGPLLKLFAVLSMLLGMWLGYLTYSRILKRTGGMIGAFVIMLVLSAIIRAGLLTPINYVFLVFVFSPPNTSFSSAFLSTYFLGLAIYTIAQTLLAIVSSYVVVVALSRANPNLEVRAWFARLKRQVFANKETQEDNAPNETIP